MSLEASGASAAAASLLASYSAAPLPVAIVVLSSLQAVAEEYNEENGDYNAGKGCINCRGHFDFYRSARIVVGVVLVVV